MNLKETFGLEDGKFRPITVFLYLNELPDQSGARGLGHSSSFGCPIPVYFVRTPAKLGTRVSRIGVRLDPYAQRAAARVTPSSRIWASALCPEQARQCRTTKGLLGRRPWVYSGCAVMWPNAQPDGKEVHVPKDRSSS